MANKRPSITKIRATITELRRLPYDEYDGPKDNIQLAVEILDWVDGQGDRGIWQHLLNINTTYWSEE